VAQTQHIKSARKTKDGDRPDCYTCHKPIEVGQGYYKNSPSRFSRTYTWHEGCPGPRSSALESNDKRGQAYAACEDAEDAVNAITGVYKAEDDPLSNVADEDFDTRARLLMEELTDIFTTLGEGVEEAAELWRESASNIEDGFGHETEKSQEMNDHADVYSDAASEASDNSMDQVTPWAEDDDATAEDFDEWIEQAKADAIDAIEGIYGMID
jgi:hypothetical protein